MEVLRVAQIIDVMDTGGIESVVMNYYRNIDRTKVQFDFITSNTSTLPQRKEIESLGGRIFLVPRVKHLGLYKKELKKVLLENKYDVVHCHMGTLAVFPLGVAKKCGVKTRICHTHTTTSKKEWKRNLLKKTLRPFAKKNSNKYFACGSYAGKWLFGKKASENGQVYVMPNSIDVDKFKFNVESRNEIRSQLGIDDKFVIGHIGRFVSVKNHIFLVDIFNDLLKVRKDVVLVLVGEGPLEESVRNYVLKLGISDYVKFLGVRKDCHKIYQALDMFILPSLYEGFPVVGVEAQCSGLPCLFSNKITTEVKLNENVKMIPLEKEVWVKELKNATFESNRVVDNFKMDIKASASELADKYFEFINENK